MGSIQNKYLITKYLLIASASIAVLVAIASLFGLFSNYPYARETENWKLQARGQDIGNLIAVVILLASALLAKRGSVRAYLIWLGALLYLLYAYVIYAVAVHFNNLFLIYVAVLGLSFYSLLLSLSKGMLNTTVTGGRKFASYTLLGLGVLFGLLWLSEIIPATLAGETPQSIKDAGLWVNPVHVIDLAAVLPAFILTGYLALKNRKAGLFFVAPWLIFAVLMGISIVATTLLMAANGFANTLPPMIMVSVVVTISLYAALRFLRHLKV